MTKTTSNQVSSTWTVQKLNVQRFFFILALFVISFPMQHYVTSKSIINTGVGFSLQISLFHLLYHHWCPWVQGDCNFTL